jgi:hypothetical protein
MENKMKSPIALFIVVTGLYVTGCIENQCDGITARGRCVGTEMQHCDDSTDGLDFWKPFFDCVEYDLSCQSHFARGIDDEFGGNGNSTGLFCVDASIQCEKSGDLKCSANGRYLLECQASHTGTEYLGTYAALVTEFDEKSFCWISPVDGVPRQVFIAGTCEGEETICKDKLVITCVDGFWTNSIDCSLQGMSCIESDGKSNCE